ncbi:alpha/beta fold hydrolase [Acidithiobacillus sp. HP-6]|uniref:alpha/beta fold hydrolase n=1 Tax=unclassified Acidithiobacillus TaxID=2614800 RepID=UPI0018799E0B|nr:MULTISPECIES: alpha/beta fold hydrolase [unclassified Acidithiobacillus]MBE7562332.1 alpha/beta fold hydrolase [Acidithiobacillus sp. HP-6]MBE7570874.1 alpha/beta fold hydrolase [Acidithiobacillus sp. HP-2]
MADQTLLIHGAWQGSWCWILLQPLLRRAGIRSTAIDLPGNGTDATPAQLVNIDLYVDHIGEHLDGIKGRVSIVGHSGGGVVATAIAERFPDRISRIVYIAGMMLPAGVSFRDVQNEFSGPNSEPFGITSHLIWSSDRLTNFAPQGKALETFYHDCAPNIAEWAVNRLTPQPVGGYTLVAYPTPERFGRIPRLYIEARHDRSVLIKAQQYMQQLVPGAEVASLDVGHVPQLSSPEKLAGILIPFLTRGMP